MASLLRIMAGAAVSVLFLFASAAGIPNTAVVDQICARENFTDGGLFYSCLHQTFNAIYLQAPNSGYSLMKECNTGNEHSGQFFGFGGCNGTLSADDCASCIKSAGLDMVSFCKNGIGAQLKLADCRVRYEDYRFDPNY